MILNLSKAREHYFQDSTITDILRQFIHKDGDIRIKDIQQLSEAKRIIGTKDGSLDQLLEKQHTADSSTVVEKIKQLHPSQLLILPPEYRIDANEVRTRIAYSLDTLVKLDANHVKRALIGNTFPRGKLSLKWKQQHQWQPERVLSTALNYLHEHKDEFINQPLLCYSWWGKDNHRHIVSLYRSIQGAELRAFQDYAAFRLLIPTYKKELRTSINLKTKNPLTPEEIAYKTKKVQRYERYLEVRNIKSSINKMDVFFTDLIEPLGGFSYQTGQMMRVPSRSKIQRDPKDSKNPQKVNHQVYKIKLTDLPNLKPTELSHNSLPWELAGNCNCEDKVYRSDRRKPQPDKGNREDFYCPHEIAASLTLRKKYETGDERTIKYLPFVLPTKDMMDYVDKLRHQAIMLYFKEDTQRWSKRALNHTEIENLLWKKVIMDGYEACFTTDINKFKEQRYDPHLDLIKFRN